MDIAKPTVMCFSGLDPTGGAGIQADIETLFSSGCHCAPIVTCLTVQNTQNAMSALEVSPALIVQQARAILEDMEIACFKIGLLTSVQTIEVLTLCSRIIQTFQSCSIPSFVLVADSILAIRI